MSFEKLKANRQSAISKLIEVSSNENAKQTFTDERIWSPTVDKVGNGYAVIRFLPAPNGSELPWVRFWDHGFQGPTGRWYIEKSRTTLGEDDPVSELNSQLWNTGLEKDKETARKRKRRLHYVSNIMVISDPANPENEGKVFLYKYGKKIMDKIMDVMQPQFEDESPVNPFDFWDGANFKLKIRNVENYRNYDKSEFDKPSALMNGDEKALEKIYNQLYALSEFTDPKSFKSYAELSKKLRDVLAEGVAGNTAATEEAKPIKESASSNNDPADDHDGVPVGGTIDDDAETLGYFARLAKNG